MSYSTSSHLGSSSKKSEIELLSIVPADNTCGPNEAVYQTLRKEVAIKCPYGCHEGEHKFLLPIRERDIPTLEHDVDDPDDYKAWMVATDPSVRLADNEKTANIFPSDSLVGDVELQSRILRFDEPSTCPFGQRWPCADEPLRWTWKDEISTILKTLHQGFNKPGFRIFTNKSTGLHVHLGHQDKGFSLTTIQNVIGVFTAFERCFDTIIPAERICGFDNTTCPLPSLYPQDIPLKPQKFNFYGTVWCAPISSRMFDFLGNNLTITREANNTIQFNKYRNTFSIPSWLNLIYATSNLKDFCDMGFNHSCTVNLENLVPSNNNNQDQAKHTIEIRLHAGSIDMQEITCWINFLVNLFTYCEKPTSTVRAFLNTHWANPNFSFVDLATHIGASRDTRTHYTNVLSGDHATTRCFNILSNQADDTLQTLTKKVETNRLLTSNQSAIETRFFDKLVSGRYGQFPLSFLTRTLNPAFFDGNADGRFLNLNMGIENSKLWFEIIEQTIDRVIEEKKACGGES